MKKKLYLVSICLSALFSSPGFAQSLPVGTPALEEFFRRGQLSGETDSALSFLIRPLTSKGLKIPDIFNPELDDTGNLLRSGSGMLRILPLSLNQQYNSTIPFGWNDGAMIPSRGYQGMISSGLFYQKGAFSIQLQPQLLYAQNKEFESFPSAYPDFMWGRYYDYYYNITDDPVRFGDKALTKFSLQQSSIRYTYRQVSLGISNENLWWGPGKHNALLMSNTAAGFEHITLNTVQPIQTPAGTFEAQAIVGRLGNSGFAPPEALRLYNEGGLPLYKTRNSEDRHLSGLILAYQPKWVKGLFVGYAGTAQSYLSDMDAVDYFPLLLPFRRFSGDNSEQKTDRYRSIFARWVLSESNVELYMEYGKNNHSYSNENIPVNPADSYAYIAGLSKLFTIKERGDKIELNLEVTELASPGKKKAGESWYVHNYVRQGYTHQGQFLGAGIGPGSSMQSADVNWNRGLKKIGLGFDRYVHNNQLYYYFFEGTKDVRRHWVDLNTSFMLQWDYRKLIFSTKIYHVKSLNYQYIFDPANEEVAFAPGKDVVNFSAAASIIYRF